VNTLHAALVSAQVATLTMNANWNIRTGINGMISWADGSSGPVPD